MTGIISCLAGLLGMLLLWSLAWWLWKQSALPPPPPADLHRRPGWPSQPIPRRTPSIPPPSWLFGPDSFEPSAPEDGAPAPRAHPSSSANTSRYSRARLERLRSHDERTEVLVDDPLLDSEDPAASSSGAASVVPWTGQTCKIGLFAVPPPSEDN